MKPTDFWKNFRLVEELSISGTFIYNGLRRYHEMHKLDNDDEIFELLYNLSVGFERLLKIAVVLHEHNDMTDQEQLEKSLITHNHFVLLNRLKKHTEIKLCTPQNELLNLLSKFYKSYRYDRFSLESAFDGKKEKKAFLQYLSTYSKVDLTHESIMGVFNDEKAKKFFQRHVLEISRKVYESIKNRATKINLYTYELRHGSKAESVFLRKVKISDEDILWKELLIFFMNTKESSSYLDFIRGIEPLGFDPGLVDEYLDCFRSDSAKSLVIGELETLYEDLDNVKERYQEVNLIGQPNVCFDDEESDDDDLEPDECDWE